jgi:hypothetical protein
VNSLKLHRPHDSELIGDSGHGETSGHTNGFDPGTTHFPSHPAFGATSVVPVNTPIRVSSDESQMPGNAPLPPGDTTTVGSTEGGFSIWLVYPGTTRAPHLYRVPASMLVRTLYDRVASMILQCAPTDFRLMVYQDHLWHTGCITDRVDPVTSRPTCYLGPRSVVTVHMLM